MIEETQYDGFDENEDNEDGGLYEHFRLEVDPGQSLLRIDKFLTNRLENASRNRIQNAAEAGNIRVNGKPVKSNYKVKPDDIITIVMDYPRRELKIIAEDIPLNIQYEDDHLLVVNKPAGLVVHPGHGNYYGTLVNALAWHFRDLPLFNSDDPRPGLVHRIDKNTSGLLVVAKTEIAKNKLAMQFFERTTSRKYIALVWGNLADDEGTIVGNIGRSLKNRQVFTVFPDEDRGKPAVTHYKVLERFDYVTLIECKLETGRTHQIRVHMQHLGHPLFNDDNYGGDVILRGTTFAKYKQFVNNCFHILPRQALHAKTLGFVHPETGQEMLFDSELAPDLAEVIEKWRNYISNRPLN
ncbi:MAG: RNA pseudouridine synthase [Bacteroidetes bacterium GWF2_42_66]|nr:MAG: RNA pseudouridine synthase [Bacteroidetes bacterium GWA2_42_15]OFX99744.1 MAG: RNA pseudouridine synthase [Bacteroidetes bacterium GWE2_42_39]OFY39782.1 MAG: RNA pseudouridine synthase [Bacteroidetes bacterium GWF2_42_66]HBL74785.1 RNA pseudouridine synthase [Prolixibacteraceae bacterium]HCR90747.1 RNA pseudouridine synthase [Prolixibacteraceae bacterium]